MRKSIAISLNIIVILVQAACLIWYDVLYKVINFLSWPLFLSLPLIVLLASFLLRRGELSGSEQGSIIDRFKYTVSVAMFAYATLALLSFLFLTAPTSFMTGLQYAMPLYIAYIVSAIVTYILSFRIALANK